MASEFQGRLGESRFALCTDGRLHGADWGSDDAAHKAHKLGYNYAALMAGQWDPVRDLCGTLQHDLIAGGLPGNKKELVDRIASSAQGFCRSALCDPTSECALIITGFAGEAQVPVMLHVLIANGQCTIKSKHDYFAIGEGAHAATMLLSHRGYDPLNTRMEKACYLLYEAKKFAETIDSVGPRDRLKIHGPIVGRTIRPEDLNEVDIAAQCIAKLEDLRQRFFMPSLPKHLDPFPMECFISAGLLDPGLTISVPKPQPPSQE